MQTVQFIRLYHNGATGYQLSDTANEQAPAKTIILAPTQDMLLTSVTLPATKRAQQVQALPYALEEQLADSIDNMHFALGSKIDNNQYAAIAVSDNLMQQWLAQLQKNHIHPDIIIPDIFALPWQPNHWSIAIENNQALVRLNQQLGFVCEVDNLKSLLQVQLQQTEQTPKAIDVTVYEAANVQNLKEIDCEVNISSSISNLLADINTSDTPPLNLLQGKYKPTHRNKQHRQQWRYAAILAIALIGIIFVGRISQYLFFKLDSSHLQAKINQIYYKAFPGATSLVAPKLRIKRELAKYNLTTAGNPFLSLLIKTAPAIKKNNITIESINYSNNQIEYKLTSSSIANINQFINAIKRQGLSVQQNTTKKGKVIQTEMTISELQT